MYYVQLVIKNPEELDPFSGVDSIYKKYNLIGLMELSKELAERKASLREKIVGELLKDMERNPYSDDEERALFYKRKIKPLLQASDELHGAMDLFFVPRGKYKPGQVLSEVPPEATTVILLDHIL